jgi:hypothetical protein
VVAAQLFGLVSCCAARAAAESARAAADTESQTVEWQPTVNEELEAHHGRSLLELTAGLALGATGYWLLMDRNVADWDNPRPQQRFDGSAWRFDNNTLAMNFLGHPFSGGIAHSFARGNHHGVWVSFAYASLTSFLWEFVLEFKEKVSVNDLLATSTAGLPIGEFLYKLGLYLDTAENPGTGSEIARWVLGTGVTLDRKLDQRPAPAVASRDALGFSSRIWHRFQVEYALHLVDSPGQPQYLRHGAGLYAKLVTLPGYLGPRSYGRGFHRAELSDFSVGSEVSEHGVGLSVKADTMLAGYHAQTAAVSARGVSVAAATFGTSMAYEFFLSSANRYNDFEQAIRQPDPPLRHHVPKRNEQLGAVHFPGLAVDWHVLSPDVNLSVAARAQPSFGGLGAPAFYDWAAANLDEKGKHVMHRQGYFYGWGGAGSLAGHLELGPLHARGAMSYARYRSQQGLDRHVERITADVHARGDALFYGASLGVQPSFSPLAVSAEFGVRRWRSVVEGFERSGHAVHRGIAATTTF